MKQKRIAAAVTIGLIVGVGLVAYLQLTKIRGVDSGSFYVDVDLIFTDNDNYTTTYFHPGGGYGWADDNTIYIRITGVGPSRIYSPTVNLRQEMWFALDNLLHAGTQTSVHFDVAFPNTIINVSTPSTLSISTIRQDTSPEGYFEPADVWLLKISNLPGTPHENTAYTHRVLARINPQSPWVESGEPYWSTTNAPLG